MSIKGLNKMETDKAGSGEIVYLIGINEIKIGQTIAAPLIDKALSSIHIGEPTIKSRFGANTSQLVGKEAKIFD